MSGTLPLSGVQAPNALTAILNDFTNIKSYCLLVQTGTASGGSVVAVDVLNIATSVLQLQSDWNAYESDTALWNALVAYVQNIYGNSGITTTTFSNAYNAAGSLLTAIETDYPHDTASPPHLLDRVWSNGVVNVTLTAAQLPNTMTQITNFLATLS